MLGMADWVMNAHATQDRPETQKYSGVEQKILSHAVEMDCGDVISFDKKLNKYFPTKKFEEEDEYMDFVEEFEAESFWDELAAKLAGRDFMEQVTKAEIDAMSAEERMSKLWGLEDWYQDEFIKNGLKKLKVEQSKVNKTH